jgi:hypothetical protein
VVGDALEGVAGDALGCGVFCEVRWAD